LSSTTEIDELYALIRGLRRCVDSLRSRFGDNPATRRLLLDTERISDDVELLDHDAAELDLDRGVARHSGEKIAVPDTQYDSEFWRDVDDEGVGGYHK
jgi:hypothetical protein